MKLNVHVEVEFERSCWRWSWSWSWSWSWNCSVCVGLVSPEYRGGRIPHKQYRWVRWWLNPVPWSTTTWPGNVPVIPSSSGVPESRGIWSRGQKRVPAEGPEKLQGRGSFHGCRFHPKEVRGRAPPSHQAADDGLPISFFSSSTAREYRRLERMCVHALNKRRASIALLMVCVRFNFTGFGGGGVANVKILYGKAVAWNSRNRRFFTWNI